jgi:hypothetical protein
MLCAQIALLLQLCCLLTHCGTSQLSVQLVKTLDEVQLAQEWPANADQQAFFNLISSNIPDVSPKEEQSTLLSETKSIKSINFISKIFINNKT